MPLTTKATASDLAGKSIGVFVVTTINEHTDYLLRPRVLDVRRDGIYTLFFPGPISEDTDDKSTVVAASFTADPGEYDIHAIQGNTKMGFATIIPVQGQFAHHVNKKAELTKGDIVYLGHIKSTLVKRGSDDPRAGQVLPLIDQEATGMSSGTFKLTVIDDFENDILFLKKHFPALKDVQIVNRPMK